jgi:hypothetical protein
MRGYDFHKVGFFRRCAAVFKISRESSSSDTARAMPMAPTSAQYAMIARDLAVPLPLPFVPRIRVASNSMLFRNHPRSQCQFIQPSWRNSANGNKSVVTTNPAIGRLQADGTVAGSRFGARRSCTGIYVLSLRGPKLRNDSDGTRSDTPTRLCCEASGQDSK